jgi:Transposase DDE domain
LDRLARECGFIQRKGKIDAFMFVMTLMFSDIDHQQLSLLDLKCDLVNHFNCDVSRVALHKRFNPKAKDFLKALLSRQLSKGLQLKDNDILATGLFNRVCIKDSTKFSLPIQYANNYPGYGSFNKNSSLMNIQYEYDLQSGDWLNLDFTKATRNDQQDSKETLESIQAGDLHLRDLGYITMSYLNHVDKEKAFYINRLPKVGVYTKKDGKFELIDWKKIDKMMKRCGFKQFELESYLGKEDKLKTRMVIFPIPERVSQERIRKASIGGKRKKKKYKLSKEYKIKANYNIFITNVPEIQMSVENIAQAYRLRWQIELVFKAWKSILLINKTKVVKQDRFECQLLAKLLWVLSNWKILQSINFYAKTTCSLMKFFKQAKRTSMYWKLVILKQYSINHWLSQIIIPVIPHLNLGAKKGDVPHSEIFASVLNDLS